MARCGLGCSFIFPLRRKCLLRDHHKRCHKGLPHREPILDRTLFDGKSDTTNPPMREERSHSPSTNPPMREERSRSPLRETASYENQNSPPKTPGHSFSEEEMLIDLHDPLGLENLESPPKNLLGFENPESPPTEDTVSVTPPRIVTEVDAGSTTMDRGTSPIT